MSSLSNHINRVKIGINPQLVNAFKSRIEQNLAEPSLTDTSRKEWVELKRRIKSEYNSGKVSFDLAVEIVHEVFDADRSVDCIGGMLVTLRRIVWPDEDGPEDPMEYEVSEGERNKLMGWLQDSLYDPNEPMNLCANLDDAYIAACQLVRAAEDARKAALGLDRGGRLAR